MLYRHRKSIALLLALSLALLLCACGQTAPAETAAPTPEPTPEPTPAPTPEPTPEPTAPPDDALPFPAPPELPELPPVSDDYFADAAFLGNSLVAGLSMFGGLEHGDFFASTSASVVNVAKMKPEGSQDDLSLLDALSQKQYGKIYILLGINEIGFEPEYFVQLYGALLDDIACREPDAVIYLMGLTPVTAKKDAEGETFSLARVQAYNRALYDLAEARGLRFVDLEDALAGPDGFLAEEESMDGIHLTRDKYPAWADYLRRHYVPERYFTANREKLD